MTPKQIRVLLALVLPLLFRCAAATTPAQPQSWGGAWDQYLARSVPYGFGGGFLVARNGEVVLRNGYGFAHREAGVAASPDTVFYSGSLTKQFTAAAIMKLADAGRLSPHDSIARYLPNVPEDKRAITLHHLMSHTGGLAHDVVHPYNALVSRDENVARILEAPLASKPGSEYAYSNPGFALLAAVVEIVSGKEYERFVHDELFAPAGMKQTGYVLAQWDRSQIAHGYEDGKDVGTPLEKANWTANGPSYSIRGAGGMLSTLDDLYRWDVALRGDRIITSAAREQLFGKHILRDDGTHYGYGWVVRETPAGRVVNHNGSDGVHYAEFRRTPTATLIGWTNQAIELYAGLHASLSRAMDSGALPKALPPVPQGVLSADERTRYSGTYRLASGGALEITEDNGRLVAEAIGQDALSLLIPSDAHTAARAQAANAFLTAAAEALRGGTVTEKSFPHRMAEVIAAQTKKLGAFERYDVIGTMNDGAGQPATFARLRFRGGSHTVQLFWNGDRIDDASLDVPNPTRALLLRAGENAVAGFNFRFEQPLHVRFDGDRVTIETPAGSVAAKKIAQ